MSSPRNGSSIRGPNFNPETTTISSFLPVPSQKILDLPIELIEKTLLKLPIEQIKSFCKTSHKAREICQSESFWQQLVWRDFKVNKLEGVDSWKAMYEVLKLQLYTVVVTSSSGNTVDHSDTYINTFLSQNEAIEYVITHIRQEESIFNFIESTEFSDKVDPTVVNALIDDQTYREFRINFFQSPDFDYFREQIDLAEKLTINEMRKRLENDEPLISFRGGYTIKYEIHRSNPLTRKNSSKMYTFIQSSYFAEGILRNVFIHATSFEEIFSNMDDSKVKIYGYGIRIYHPDSSYIEYIPLEKSVEPFFVEYMKRLPKDLLVS